MPSFSATSSPPRPVDAGKAAGRPQPPQIVRDGMLAGVWAAISGVSAVGAFTVLAWLTAPDSGTSTVDVVRTAVRMWLLAHGTAMPTRAGSLSLVPLGLTLVLAAILAAIVIRSVRESLPVRPPRLQFACYLGGLWAGYASVGLLAQLWAGPVRAGAVVTTAAGALLLVVLIGGPVAVRGVAAGAAVRARVPQWLGAAVRGAAVAVAGLGLTGLAVTALAVALNFSAVMASADRLDAGAAGNVLMVVTQAAYVPVFVIWAASVAVGPGFALGESAGVSVSSSSVLDPPAVPVLAAIPSALPWWTWLLVALPVLVGAAAGWRATASARNATAGLGILALLAPLTGLAWMALSLAASGSLADGFYRVAGPAVLANGLLVTVEVGLGAAGAWYLRYGPPVTVLVSRLRRRVDPR